MGPVHLARLGTKHGPGFVALQTSFVRANPGYDLAFVQAQTEFRATASPQVLFVQAGRSEARSERGQSAIGIGDLILLRPGDQLRCDRPVDLLAVGLPTDLPPELPTFLRPDWDPCFTDTPGGCATDDDAYRRVVLTWLGKHGPYQLRCLNAHRVRMTDSFSHYHPIETGFDEFYLVQGASADAAVITSTAVERIEQPHTVSADEAAGLLTRTPLQVGDLFYAPRGTVHRGVGGVLAHVITVPGFVPGSEIGVDHHLRAINLQLGLTADRALPFHTGGADRAIVK